MLAFNFTWSTNNIQEEASYFFYMSALKNKNKNSISIMRMNPCSFPFPFLFILLFITWIGTLNSFHLFNVFKLMKLLRINFRVVIVTDKQKKEQYPQILLLNQVRLGKNLTLVIKWFDGLANHRTLSLHIASYRHSKLTCYCPL
jgi:hypothetical protein